jgi:hypothetical protein
MASSDDADRGLVVCYARCKTPLTVITSAGHLLALFSFRMEAHGPVCVQILSPILLISFPCGYSARISPIDSKTTSKEIATNEANLEGSITGLHGAHETPLASVYIPLIANE